MMSTKTKKYFVLTFSVFFLFLFSINNAYAQCAPQTPRESAPGSISVTLMNPLNICSIQDLLVTILNIVMILMIPVIVFFIIYAGFLYVTARGNAEQVKSATRALTYAVIGAILVVGAFAITEIIRATVSSFAAPQSGIDRGSSSAYSGEEYMR